jgi:acyl dehydratase
VSADGIEIGHEIPKLELTLSGDQVRRFATAGQMPGPRFMSDEAARKEGLPGQILPGNMSMALLSRMVLDWLPAARLEKLGVTFRGLVMPGKKITCSGFVTDRSSDEKSVTLECDVILECDGEQRVTGLAVLRVDRKEALSLR